MPPNASSSRRDPREVRRASEDATLEILLADGVIDVRNPSGSGDPIPRLTPSQMEAILRCAQEFNFDIKLDGVPEQRGTSFERENAKYNGETEPTFKWFIKFATADGRESERLRIFLVMTVLMLTSAIIFVVGICVAVHVGTPQLITCGISAAGSVTFALVPVLVSRLRRRKAADQKSP